MEQEYEWQDEHYQHLACEVQQQLCDIIPYGADIEWLYIDNWVPYFGGHSGHIFLMDDKRTKYSLQTNRNTIKNVVSVCCMADSGKLVAYVITQKKRTKECSLVPLFVVTGDMEDVETFEDFMRIGGQMMENNKIEKKKKKKGEK